MLVLFTSVCYIHSPYYILDALALALSISILTSFEDDTFKCRFQCEQVHNLKVYVLTEVHSLHSVPIIMHNFAISCPHGITKPTMLTYFKSTIKDGALCYGTRCSYTNLLMDWSLSNLSLFPCKSTWTFQTQSLRNLPNHGFETSRWPTTKANKSNNNERIYTPIC